MTAVMSSAACGGGKESVWTASTVFRDNGGGGVRRPRPAAGADNMP